jgi:hypothetical protein
MVNSRSPKSEIITWTMLEAIWCLTCKFNVKRTNFCRSKFALSFQVTSLPQSHILHILYHMAPARRVKGTSTGRAGSRQIPFMNSSVRPSFMIPRQMCVKCGNFHVFKLLLAMEKGKGNCRLRVNVIFNMINEV